MALVAGQYAALETSAYGEILNRVCQQVIDLDLTSILGRVYILQQSFDQALADSALMPCAVISMAPESSSDQEGPVNTSSVHYPVLISMIWGTDRGQRTNWADQLLHRQQVAQAFRKTRPTWTSMVNCTLKRTTVKAGEPFVPEALRQGLDAQWLLVDALVTEVLAHA